MSTPVNPSGSEQNPYGQPYTPAESPVESTYEQTNPYAQPAAAAPAPEQMPYGDAYAQAPDAQAQYAQEQYADPQAQQAYQAPYAAQPGYGAQYSYGAPAQVGGKSKIVAGILGILLGVFGVHNFYLGRTGRAVAQLLITILSLGIFSFVSALWGLVEGILILVSSPGTPWHQDAQGYELTD